MNVRRSVQIDNIHFPYAVAFMHEGEFIRARVISLLERGDPTLVPTAAFAGEVEILREYLQEHPSEVCWSETHILCMLHKFGNDLWPHFKQSGSM